jgi:hypothetical protein
MLFLGGFILPSLTGIMLNSVDDHLRGSANSVAMLSYNLLGFMQAPFIYGLISKIVEKQDDLQNKSRIPMMCLLYSVFLTITFATVGIRKKMAFDYDKE